MSKPASRVLNVYLLGAYNKRHAVIMEMVMMIAF
jgi:hypothetical protein